MYPLHVHDGLTAPLAHYSAHVGQEAFSLVLIQFKVSDVDVAKAPPTSEPESAKNLEAVNILLPAEDLNSLCKTTWSSG